jgi:predicted transcriptional regulator
MASSEKTGYREMNNITKDAAPAIGIEPLLEETTSIAAAYLGNNHDATSEIPTLIRTIHEALTTLGQPAEPEVAAKPTPAVPIRKSVTPDYLVCLEDGKKLKMLKRHLRSTYGMTPDEYRAKWGLPADYPMVAPNYAERRSQFAKQIGLGRTRRTEPEPETVPVSAPAKTRRRSAARNAAC